MQILHPDHETRKNKTRIVKQEPETQTPMTENRKPKIRKPKPETRKHNAGPDVDACKFCIPTTKHEKKKRIANTKPETQTPMTENRKSKPEKRSPTPEILTQVQMWTRALGGCRRARRRVWYTLHSTPYALHPAP